MRAIGSILFSVMFLAIIQISYVSASNVMMSDRDMPEEKKGHHKGDSSHHHSRDKKNHHVHVNKHEDDKQQHHNTDVDNRKPKHKNEEKKEQHIRPVVPPYFEVDDGYIRSKYDNPDERKSKLRVERVEVVQQPENHEEDNVRKVRKSHPMEKSGDLYDRVQADSPMEDSNNERDSHNKKEKRKNKKKNKKDKQKKDKKGKKNKNKKDNTCQIDEDCNHGRCCVPKKGKKVCKKSHTRDLGEKCASSCMCNEGMRCFVSQYKRNGEKIVRIKKRLMGRCVNPSIADQSQGFFIEENVSK